MNFNLTPYLVGFGIFLALAATVLTYIFVLPEGKIKKMTKIFGIIRDIFTFKNLYLEKALQALYILSTIACITVGVLMIFSFDFSTGYFGGIDVNWYGGWGFLILLAGPIVTRLVYEVIMMFVLLVKNTIDINNKLK